MEAIDLPLWSICRQSDPPTSRIAARMAGGLMADHHKRILEALRAGPAGASEIAERCGLDGHQVGKRLGEMGRAGLIATTGSTVRSAGGRPERQWRAL